jgi:hypothetical protein
MYIYAYIVTLEGAKSLKVGDATMGGYVASYE